LKNTDGHCAEVLLRNYALTRSAPRECGTCHLSENTINLQETFKN